MARSATAKTPNWYVLTGAPSSGVTTLADALRPRLKNALVFPEAARVYIDEVVAQGIPAAELRKDEGKFQRKVLEIKLRTEESAPRDQLCIFERGIPDSIPYYRVAGLDPEPLRSISRRRYSGVFYVEPLDYVPNYARTETPEARAQLIKELFEVYVELGYSVVRLVKESVEQRVAKVLAQLTADGALKVADL